MTDKERIAELERRVRDLEARPVYIGYPIPVPALPWVPTPWDPGTPQPPYIVTCGS